MEDPEILVFIYKMRSLKVEIYWRVLVDRACVFPSIAPANLRVFSPPGPPNSIYISLGLKGVGYPIFMETSIFGIHKLEWFYTLLRQVKIEPFIMWSLSD